MRDGWCDEEERDGVTCIRDHGRNTPFAAPGDIHRSRQLQLQVRAGREAKPQAAVCGTLTLQPTC
jgi:hypothetical protein